MPSQLDTSELREKILTLGVCIGPYDSPHRCSSLHCDHCGLCDVSEEILALLEAHIQQEVESARIEERGHTCKLINDLRYQVVTLDFAKELSLERLTTLQVEQEMRLIQTNSPPAEQEAH